MLGKDSKSSTKRQDLILKKMMEEPRFMDSPEEWKKHHETQFSSSAVEGNDGKTYFSIDWILGKEIRVFKCPGIRDVTALNVASSFQQLVDDIGLNIQVKNYGIDKTINNQLEISLENDRCDANILKRHLISNSPDKPYASVVIIDKKLTFKDYWWGQSEMKYGYALISLAGKRQDTPHMISNVSRHEATHMFGLEFHHDRTMVKGYRDQNCNFIENCLEEDYTCPKCLDAITYFWKGIEKSTGERFFT